MENVRKRPQMNNEQSSDLSLGLDWGEFVMELDKPCMMPRTSGYMKLSHEYLLEEQGAVENLLAHKGSEQMIHYYKRMIRKRNGDESSSYTLIAFAPDEACGMIKNPLSSRNLDGRQHHVHSREGTQIEPDDSNIFKEKSVSRKTSGYNRKTCYVFWLIAFQVLLSMCGVLANANPLPDKSVLKLFSYEILSTRSCNSRSLDMSDTCQTDTYLLDLFMNDQCEFKCNPGEKPTCVNTQQGGSAFVCLPVDLQCEKGVRRVGRRDENNSSRLIVWEEACPDGTYQPYTSTCFDACLFEHRDTDNIPEKYVLFSRGDNTSPTLVYCNYREGFYNVENKTLVDYDAEGGLIICQRVYDFNHCLEEEEFLSNRTCVKRCPSGICRDDHGMFACKLNCSSKERITEKTSVGDTRSDVITTPRHFETSSTDRSISLKERHNDQEKKASPRTNLVVIVIAVFVVALTVFIATAIICLWSKATETTTKNNNISKSHCTKIKVHANGDAYVYRCVEPGYVENV